MDGSSDKLHARALEILGPWLLENGRSLDDYNYEEYAQALVAANKEFTKQRVPEILADRGVAFPTQNDYREAEAIARMERPWAAPEITSSDPREDSKQLMSDLQHDRAMAILESTGKALTAESYRWALDEAARKFGAA